MSDLATTELWSIFDARRVKAPELRGLDIAVNGVVGFFKNRRPVLHKLKQAAQRIELMEEEIHALGATRFREEVGKCRELAQLTRLEGDALGRGLALAREAAWRAIGKRPFPVQLMGALAMCDGNVAEMATGEGKTLPASLAASIWAWAGRPVHIITVNDYLVARDAQLMAPVYEMLGHRVGHVIHETTPQDRVDHYRRGVVYVTSKELVADFLRDQIALGNLRTSAQTAVGMLMNPGPRNALMLPGLFKVLVDEADSLLIDEAVTPLIISNSPDDEANATLYRAADEMARALRVGRDFTIDRTVRSCDLTARGQERLDHMSDGSGFWKDQRRRE